MRSHSIPRLRNIHSLLERAPPRGITFVACTRWNVCLDIWNVSIISGLYGQISSLRNFFTSVFSWAVNSVCHMRCWYLLARLAMVLAIAVFTIPSLRPQFYYSSTLFRYPDANQPLSDLWVLPGFCARKFVVCICVSH